MVFGRKKKAESKEALLPSEKRSGFFRRKPKNHGESQSLPSKSRFMSLRGKQFKFEEEVPEYETPPPSPLYSDGQSPLHVAVVATRSSPSGMPDRDNNSLSGTTISDLSGSMVLGPVKVAKPNGGDGAASYPSTPYSREPSLVEEPPLEEPPKQEVTEMSTTDGMLCNQDTAADIVNNIFGLVEKSCDRNERSPDEVLSVETPTVANKDRSRHDWGTAPSMSDDEEETTLGDGTGQDTQATTQGTLTTGQGTQATTQGTLTTGQGTQTTGQGTSDETSFSRFLEKATNGGVCTGKDDLEAKKDDDTARNTANSGGSDKSQAHENFELVLEEQDDRSASSGGSRRGRRWLRGRNKSNRLPPRPEVERLPETPKRKNDGSWRKSPTDFNGEGIPLSEFTIEKRHGEAEEQAKDNRSVTSDMNEEERYRAVFGVDPDVDKANNKKKPRRMFQAMSKRLVKNRGNKEEEQEMSKLDAEKVSEPPAEPEVVEDEENADSASYLQMTIENLSEEELVGEELVEDEQETGVKKRFSFLSKRSGRGSSAFEVKKINSEVERAFSKDGEKKPPLKASRSWGLGRSNNPSAKQPDQGAKDKEPKSLTRTLSNPLKKLSGSFTTKKEKPKPEKPDWKAVADPNSGNTYYYHRVTRQTTWSKPSEFDKHLEDYEIAKTYGESVKPARKSRFSPSFDLSAEQQKRLEEGGSAFKPKKRSLTSVLRKKSSRDFNRDVWATKQEIAMLLKGMGPKDAGTAEELMTKYEGNEQELLIHLRALAESQPFDEPLEMDETIDNEEEKKEESDKVRRTLTMATASTGASGLSSRVRSGRTALTSLTDTTQKVKNTDKRLKKVIEPIPEAVTHANTSVATALSSDMEDDVIKDTTSRPVVGAPTRERELRVEEFTSGRYDRKRAEVFDTKIPPRPHHHSLARQLEQPDELSSAADEEETDVDTYGTDSVSELGHSDAEFQRQKRRYDLARRMALDDAIKNGDWELAANVTENIRGRSFDSKASSVSYHEWTQSELDQFISENDWDAVATYIAFMRDKNKGEDRPSGYDIPHLQDRSSPKKSFSRGRSENTREPEPRKTPQPRRNEPDTRRSGPQKRFGARSQLQHNDNELISIASSWDSVYRTDSSDDSFYTSSESSYDYRNRRRNRRMAT